MKKNIESNAMLNVLFLEDVLKDAEFVNEMLKDAGFRVSMDIAKKGKEYLSFLNDRNYDIILADYTLPGFNALAALKLALELQPDVPFICVSGTIGEDKAVELLKQGATDYVLKDRLDRLPFAIRRALEEAKNHKELRKVDEALQEEKNFHHFFSESLTGIRIVSIDGETIYANKAFLDIFRYDNLNEFTKTRVIDRYTPESCAQYLERKEKRKNGNEVSDYEISIIRKNEDICHLKVSRKEIIWNGIKHFQVVYIDISEQKKLTSELIAAKEHAEESDRLKSAFLANMSHEIRTPMNGILGFAELLKEPGLSGEEQRDYIKIIEKSGTRMLNIINDIVDISKIESGLMEVNVKNTNINEQIEFIYTFFKPEVESKGMKLSIKNSLPSSESVIKTDREKIYAILTNLVKNAIKYSNNGIIELGYNHISNNYPVLEFFVKDTGIGIPEDRQEAIFQRFVQADIGDKRAYQGAGLGLSITKAYVEMLGGQIWVESESEKGSTFYFTIPYKIEPIGIIAPKNVVPDHEDNNQIKNLKVLIAEDNEISEMLLRKIIEIFSKEVLIVRNGLEAIKACRNNPDIDLIMMDIKMPEMNGHEATRQIRQFNKTVVIIAQTAYALIGDRAEALDAGCNDYISKPISYASIKEIIKKHFTKQGDIKQLLFNN